MRKSIIYSSLGGLIFFAISGYLLLSNPALVRDGLLINNPAPLYLLSLICAVVGVLLSLAALIGCGFHIARRSIFRWRRSLIGDPEEQLIEAAKRVSPGIIGPVDDVHDRVVGVRRGVRGTLRRINSIVILLIVLAGLGFYVYYLTTISTPTMGTPQFRIYLALLALFIPFFTLLYGLFSPRIFETKVRRS